MGVLLDTLKEKVAYIFKKTAIHTSKKTHQSTAMNIGNTANGTRGHKSL